MAIQVSSLILSALQRAAAEPEGLALVATRSAPGLFNASAAGKQAAQRCKEDGLLQVLRTEAKGKSALEICALTDRGLKHLLDQTSPRPVLEALLQAVERCEARLREVVSGTAQQHQHLESLRALAGKLLDHLPKGEAATFPWHANGHPKPVDIIMDCLRVWHAGRQLGDCPLPELYRRAVEASKKLTIGQFHDAVRALDEQRKVYLHPWTGPLYEMPEPALALLSGHEIAYYASLPTP
ncbi:MAG: hypothetical protein L0Y71_16080 [Gemmataceae bacterium]|nr:hypothetical protein [Gemmataceae bacterium]